MSEPADAAVREEALSAAQSFIVQAPAGSGKTELLTRRILTLLARVERPEQVLAITFSRKAAGEMRQRVLGLLRLAQAPADAAADPHLASAVELAREVLRRDEQYQWRLLENPSRLSLQTIDSLCAAITRQMPVTSQLGAALSVQEDATRLYQHAATRCIEDNLRPGDAGFDALTRLLDHLDNNVERLQQLLTTMLARRDQWLRHTSVADSRVELEGALQEWAAERFDTLAATLPECIDQHLVATIRHAAFSLKALGKDSAVIGLAECSEIPQPQIEAAVFWQAFADLLLTRDGTLRKRLSRSEGFPVSAADADLLGLPVATLREHKRCLSELLVALAQHDRFISVLAETRGLPLQGYADSQWEIIEALFVLLQLAFANLLVEFAAQGSVDFSEISICAARALGEPEAPTDLALVLDYRLSHILVDEFQDTSISQFELFERLVAGWEPGDGRTFFAVGDPMQSIYRFRSAEVSLFLRAAEFGIGDVHLKPLQLTTNFRSLPSVVNWCNLVFEQIFPPRADGRTGAVTYSPSIPFKTGGQQVACHVHAFIDSDKLAQAEHVASVTQQSLHNTEGNIAILVRSKSALAEIFTALQRQEISYQAVDIETLGDRLVVKDLQSLLAALLHPQDRLHWTAVLRAPWCGLTLTDLHVLLTVVPESESTPVANPMQPSVQAGKEPGADTEPASASAPVSGSGSVPGIWSRLQDREARLGVSPDGQRRIERLVSVLAPVLERVGREPIVPWLESCWLRLGGPVGTSVTDRLAADACLRELAAIEAAGSLWDRRYVEHRMQSLFAPPVQGDTVRVQIMTIHKSKGLEFDTVLLPALGRGTSQDQTQLLNWFEYQDRSGEPQLLLAPIPEANSGVTAEPVLKLVRQQQQLKSDNELLRLLYVAATRARSGLHLFGHVLLRANELSIPPRNTLLRPLWPVVNPEFEHALASQEFDVTTTEQDTAVVAPPLYRLPVDTGVFNLQSEWVATSASITAVPADVPVRFDWAGLDARYVGTVVHRQLQRMADEGLMHWPAERIGQLASFYRQRLMQLGVPGATLDHCVRRVSQALENATRDPRAQWLLGQQQEARSEFRLTGFVNQQLINGVIDRTFVDEQGVRWIIDYKTGDHQGGQVEQFLDREQRRYQVQLERYAAIMGHMESREVRLGLYFPLLQSFRDWQPGLS